MMQDKIGYMMRFTATALLISILYACTSPEDYLNKGFVHYDAGQYAKAAMEFRNVLKIEKNNIDARYHLALSEEMLGYRKSAYKHYLAITQSDHRHVMSRVRLAALYIIADWPDEAHKLIDEIRQIDPENAMIPVLLAKVHVLRNDLKTATRFARSAYDSTHRKSAQVALLLAKLYAEQKQTIDSIRVLHESLAYNATDLQLQLYLAYTYINTGSTAYAKILLDNIEIPPHVELSYHIELTQLYTRLNMLDDAERVLRDVVENYAGTHIRITLVEFLAKHRTLPTAITELLSHLKQSPGNYQLQFLLGKLYEQNKQTDKAENLYREIINRAKFSTEGLKARRELAQLLINKANKEEATKLLDEVLLHDPADHEARLSSARIYLQEGDIELSATEVNNILNRKPHWLPALRMLADIYLKNKNSIMAEETLRKAAENHPHNVDTQLALAGLMEKNGNTADALQHLITTFKLTPGHPRVLEEIIKIQTHTKNWEQARKNIEQYKKAHPQSPTGFFLSGLMYQAMGEEEASRNEFVQCLQLNPNLTEPLTALVKSYISKNKGNEAVLWVKEFINEYPANVFAHHLLGEAYLSEKRYALAESSFRKAILLQPQWAKPYISLGDMQLQNNQSVEAFRTYKLGIEKNTDNIAVHLKLANAYEQLAQYDSAIVEYEKILAKHPGAEIAANNLSMLLVNHKDDKKSRQYALQLVQRFSKSDELVFRDTLAWVLYKNGKIDSAISNLIDIVEKAPHNQLFHYHLGMAHHMKGYNKLARLHLQKALQGNPGYHGVEEARRTLSKLENPGRSENK